MLKNFIYDKHVKFFELNCRGLIGQKTIKKYKIDKKHQNLIKQFEKIYKFNKKDFVNNLRNWEFHGDLSCPPQITFAHIKILGLLKTFKLFLKKIINFFDLRFFNQSFFDDLEILRQTNSFKILKKNPAHKTPQCNDFYFIENTSTNYRWNRYAYLANNVAKKNLLKNKCNYLDIGSFYGGFQSFIKNLYPQVNLILLDFNHQLCRSYVFLKSLFPNSNHLLPDQITSLEFLNRSKNYIVYLPIEKRRLLKTLKIELTTNFFSFGEMKREIFDEYLEIINHSKYIYIVNRFVSSPFFEKTYDTDLNIRDYLKSNLNILYFDVFPIHHYLNIKRRLLNKFANRPTSSSYFELILNRK